MANANVFIQEITFNDETVLPLNTGSIVIFTGTNNSGKSQALKDIEIIASKQTTDPQEEWFLSAIGDPVVIHDIKFDIKGELSDEFLLQGFSVYEGRYETGFNGLTRTFSKNDLYSSWGE